MSTSQTEKAITSKPGLPAYCNRRRNRWWAATWGLLSLPPAAFGVAFAAVPLAQATDDPSMAALSPVFLALAFCGFRCARRAWSAEVAILPDEVVVRGPWATRRLPRSTVAGFTAGLQPAGSMNPTPGVLLTLTDGSSVSIWTLATEGAVWNEDKNIQRWRATAEALNAVLNEHEGER